MLIVGATSRREASQFSSRGAPFGRIGNYSERHGGVVRLSGCDSFDGAPCVVSVAGSQMAQAYGLIVGGPHVGPAPLS